MDLLEYQAKKWFREIAIPILPSQKIDHPRDLKTLKVPYPVVLKSQVHTGGRSKAGGVRFVSTTIDAIAAAQNIFNLPILGELPEVLLAEAKYETDREFYLAVVLDGVARRPVLLGSPQGGIHLESAWDKIECVVVEQEFSPFYARRLAVKMGLEGALIQSVSAIIEKMYRLFVEKDLDLLEINPLGVSAKGEVMALDGKVTVNDRAIERHPEIAAMAAKMASRTNNKEKNGALSNWDSVERHGKIGILANGTGLLMTTLDLVTNAGGKPATCLNLTNGFAVGTGFISFEERLEQGLQILTQDKGIQVIMLNLIGSFPTALEVADVIANFLQHRDSSNGTKSRALHHPRLIIRLAGNDFSAAQRRLIELDGQNVPIVLENLDEAVAEAVRLAKSITARRL